MSHMQTRSPMANPNNAEKQQPWLEVKRWDHIHKRRDGNRKGLMNFTQEGAELEEGRPSNFPGTGRHRRGYNLVAE